MLRLRPLAALLSLAAFAACEKNAVQQIAAPISGGAYVRFHNLGVSAPGVNFYANDQKVTGVNAVTCTPTPVPPNPLCETTGVEATTGVVYGSSAIGGNYAMLVPGQYTLSGRIAAATDNGLAIASASTSLAAEKFYSYFVSGIYNTATKRADSFLVEDNLPTTFDYSKAYIRVLNASSNAPTISTSVTRQGTTEVVSIATNLAYKSATSFITVTPGLTDITVTVGTTTRTFTDFNLTGGHFFTLALRGDATSTSTTTGLAINAFANR